MRLSTSLPYEPVGKLSHVDVLEKEFGKLATLEVVLTREQEAHAKERHPDAEEEFKRVRLVVRRPDAIIVDGNNKNTVMLVKDFGPSLGLAVVRLVLVGENETEGLKNSIITFRKTGRKRLEGYLKNRKVLYRSKKLS